MTLSTLRSHLIECFEPDFRIVGNITQREIVEAIDAEAARLAAMTAARNEACNIADGLSMYIALDNPYAKPSERRDRIVELAAVGKNPS